MRTNININDDLVNEAFKYTKAKTKKELIDIALRELVENRKRLNLLDLAGKIKFEEDYDYKSLRKGT